jgi:polar amino acid transport system substrate-binding protein
MNRRDFAARFGAAAGLVSVAAAQSPSARAQEIPGESTWDRIHRTKVMRIGVVANEEPGFHKDLATGEWTGNMLSMARDIASVLDVKLELLETTYGNSVLDLQANKIDVGFALQATPKRALVINFTRPIYSIGITAILHKGFSAAKWADLNKPEVRIAVDLGSIYEAIARHFAPQAQIVGLADRQAVNMAVIAGRADACLSSSLAGIIAVKRNPQLGTLIVPPPEVSLGVYFGTRYEQDQRMVQFLSAWGDYNHQVGQVRQWIIDSLKVFDMTAADVPESIKF